MIAHADIVTAPTHYTPFENAGQSLLWNRSAQGPPGCHG